jgi:hypothetical protein
MEERKVLKEERKEGGNTGAEGRCGRKRKGRCGRKVEGTKGVLGNHLVLGVCGISAVCRLEHTHLIGCLEGRKEG